MPSTYYVKDQAHRTKIMFGNKVQGKLAAARLYILYGDTDVAGADPNKLWLGLEIFDSKSTAHGLPT